jgi:hypothetical protein
MATVPSQHIVKDMPNVVPDHHWSEHLLRINVLSLARENPKTGCFETRNQEILIDESE